MLNAKIEFDRRNFEVNEYLQYLTSLEENLGLSASLMNTMKSSALLMLYNIIESTMTDLMQDIFDHYATVNVSFDSLNEKMKTLILAYSKRRKPSSLVSKMLDSNINLVIACFERADIFSGNVDCQKIRETMNEIGIASTNAYSEIALLTVKTERNGLAHGSKSFADCGRTYTTADLKDLHFKIDKILDNVIVDFEKFIVDKAYA